MPNTVWKEIKNTHTYWA